LLRQCLYWRRRWRGYGDGDGYGYGDGNRLISIGGDDDFIIDTSAGYGWCISGRIVELFICAGAALPS
jgi:hypothetical protein